MDSFQCLFRHIQQTTLTGSNLSNCAYMQVTSNRRTMLPEERRKKRKDFLKIRKKQRKMQTSYVEKNRAERDIQSRRVERDNVSIGQSKKKVILEQGRIERSTIVLYRTERYSVEQHRVERDNVNKDKVTKNVLLYLKNIFNLILDLHKYRVLESQSCVLSRKNI